MGKKPKVKYMDYPEPVKKDIGCKVSWYYYTEMAQSQEAATAAKHNAVIQQGLGYDFGYNAPGSISQTRGMYEVCIP